MVSAGHVGGTRGLGIVSSGADVLWMSMVCGMRGVGEVCAMCLARGGEWMRRLGLGFTNPVKQGECWTCVCVWVAVVYVDSG